jgi:hypothetical protein
MGKNTVLDIKIVGRIFKIINGCVFLKGGNVNDLC